ncbi:MAG: TIGR01212 family radical SAM protein [Lachnospiraceae bacterium]|nr:TIGR01212 family radical SAM protein [Lachnospiraceae bacterium]
MNGKDWHGKRYYSFDSYIKHTFGTKLYKVSLDAGCTCPTRDGTKGFGGCTFCSTAGSGDFASAAHKSITEQIEDGIALLKNKLKDKAETTKYIAYFQAFTSTYGDVNRLRSLFVEAATDERIAAISIGTRPDCLPPEILDLLSEIAKIKPLFIELGLQTIHEQSAIAFHRGYPLETFDRAVKELYARDIPVVVHLILGLPGETKEDMLASVTYMNKLPIHGVKLSMLHILSDTAMGQDYVKHPFHVFELEEYVDFLITCLEHLREDIVVHRITGDGPKDLLIAPLWSGNKRLVLNTIAHEMKQRHTYQGVKYE